MKKVICSAVCILFFGSVFAQELFPVPTRTCEQKYTTVKYQTYSTLKSAINFAKSQGVSALDFGIYTGNLYAPSWNADIGFEGFVKSSIQTWESFKTELDGQIVITENTDGSVSMNFPKIAMSKYFTGDKPMATFEEAVDYFRGALKPIAAKFNSTVTLTVTETTIVFHFKKN